MAIGAGADTDNLAVEAVVLDEVCGQIGTLIGVHMAVFAQ
jgi:hypothetical protein